MSGPVLSWLNPWVGESWVGEFSIMVLLEEVLSDGGGDSEEVLDVLEVGKVQVEVVLEVLEHGHVVLNELVSSNSWE